MLKKLSSPYRLETSISKRWSMCLAFGAFVFLFLFIFQPFGLNTLPGNILAVTLGYGFICFVVMVILNVIIIPLVPRFFSEERWTLGKELAWTTVNIFLIGLANTFYTHYIGLIDLSLERVITYEFFTLALGVFPVGASIMLNESRLKKIFEKQSDELNQLLEETPLSTESAGRPASEKIVIKGENEHLDLRKDQVLFIRSSDNYVEVFSEDSGKTTKRLIRASLKSVTSGLECYEEFFRCHKSYLVNLKKVKHISGNAQGYKLHFEGTDLLVPVSRTYNESIGNQLAALRE